MPWYSEGYMVQCEIDLKDMTLAFMVNGKTQGIAYHLNKYKYYHFVLFMTDKDDTICVQSENITVRRQTIAQIRNPSFVFFFFFLSLV